MNYLVHLLLAEDTPASLLGNLMGDFVKGRLDDTFPPAIREGIALHRQVDVFAHHHPVYRRSRLRLAPVYGHGRGIMVDVFYDHFLARNWNRHHPLPLEEFAGRIYRLLEEHFPLLPPGLQRVAPRMIRHDWLVSYRDVETIGLVLERIAGRLRRPLPLGRGVGDLRRHYGDLEGDCEEFLAEARAFVEKRPAGG